ncbi:MAG: hypothetical protein IJU91_10195, partial [Selenomonadaceae bacterium]|nr:hypothetical protein [Selenomonadaceae bacterium]
FFNLGFRAEVDDRSEKTGKKIRDAQVKKIPYTIVIGDKEIETGILPITDVHADFAYKLAERFFNLGFRAEVDDRSEKTGKKIRDAQVKKIPYTIVIGDKEIETGVLPIRKHGEKDSVNMSVDDFISYVQAKISSREETY